MSIHVYFSYPVPSLFASIVTQDRRRIYLIQLI
jgi:hypothetical protein